LHIQIYSTPLHFSVNYYDYHQAGTKYKYERKNATDETIDRL